MTLIRNNPRSKYVRRISAAERLGELIQKYNSLLLSGQTVIYSVENPLGMKPQDIQRKIGIAERELLVLKERIAKPGNNSTKKSGANTGRRM